MRIAVGGWLAQHDEVVDALVVGHDRIPQQVEIVLDDRPERRSVAAVGESETQLDRDPPAKRASCLGAHLRLDLAAEVLTDLRDTPALRAIRTLAPWALGLQGHPDLAAGGGEYVEDVALFGGLAQPDHAGSVAH